MVGGVLVVVGCFGNRGRFFPKVKGVRFRKHRSGGPVTFRCCSRGGIMVNGALGSRLHFTVTC